MSKKTILLIVLLFIITSFLVFVALYGSKNQTGTTPTPTPSTSQKQAILTISQDTTNPASKSADVNLSALGNKVTGVQMVLSYDPEVLDVTDIIPGSFFSNPTVLNKDIDDEKGIINFAVVVSLGEEGISVPVGTVAKILYTEKATTAATTIIKFLPDTVVSAQGTSESVLAQTQEGIIKLDHMITPTTTPLIPAASSSGQ